jgi:hypothetical protein
MADSEVAITEAAEEAAPQAQPAPSAVDNSATLKAQLSAADAARVKAQNDSAQVAKDRDAALARLAEYEQANMSEMEKLQKERDAWKSKAEAEATEKEQLRLSHLYPNATEAFAGDRLPSEATLAALEKRLAIQTQAAVDEAVPPAIPNPQKERSAPVVTLEDKRARLLGMPLPDGWTRK